MCVFRSYSKNAFVDKQALSFLGPKHLLDMSTTSTYFFSQCTSDVLWKIHLDNLWSNKIYVPKKFLRQSGKCYKKYFESLKDSKRKCITRDELTSFTWFFRFKESAGSHWINLDPFWSSVREDPDREPKCISHKFTNSGRLQRLDKNETNLRAPWDHFRWSFVGGGRDADRGFKIRVNNFPPYVISRHSNWGFICESCWVVQVSFPFPPIHQDHELMDMNLKVSSLSQMEDIDRYNRMQLMFDDDSSENSEEEGDDE